MSTTLQRTVAPVLAAGVLAWRERGGETEVLLVERTQHRDLSLPKGKLDRGETLPECAVRELEEETGYRLSLGASVGHSEYRLPDGRDKVVYYWSAEVTDEPASAFEPNDEILAVRWATLAAAKRECTYRHDAAIIESFERRLAAGTHRTFPIIAMRHANAQNSNGADFDRVLSERGQRQARAVAGGLAAFALGKIVTSPAVRCRQTLAPTEAVTGISAKALDELWQGSFSAEAASAIEARIVKAVQKRKGLLLCSHAPVIPDVVTAVVHATEAEETERTHRASMLHTAEFTVMHVSAGERPALVTLETHGP